MTDNEIICAMLAYSKINILSVNGEFISIGDILDLISRQKEEIEALIAGQETLQRYISTAKVEAVIEFFEKLIDISVCKDNGDGSASLYVSIPKARQVIKEMVGDTDAET